MTPETYIRKIEDQISINSIFPSLRSENEFLFELLNDAKKLFGLDVPTEIDKLKEEMNNGK